MPMTQPVSLPPEQPGVFRSLARVLPYAKADLPRLGLGMLIALISSGFALAIPLTLEALVDGPLRTGNTSLVWGAAGLVALLGAFGSVVCLFAPDNRFDTGNQN